MKKKIIVLISLFISILVISCNPGERRSQQGSASDINLVFPIETSNKDKAIDGGTLNVAIVKDDPLVGIFNEALYSDGFDYDVLGTFLSSTILNTDENFEVIDTGIARLDVDTENKKATITIQGDYKWSDGTPLTADDIIYAYEFVGHPEYEGVRYTEDAETIIGMAEYHSGKSDNISGIKKIDDKTVEISFNEMSQSIYTLGNGLLYYALPKHHLGDIPMKEMFKSDKIRSNLVTLGAYNLVNLVPGESYELEANEYYYLGKPKIPRVVVQIINTQTIVSELKTGQYDITFQLPSNLYSQIKDFENLDILGREELYYSYLGVKMGKYDNALGKNVTDPNAKMGDKRLRQALIYAVDVEQMINAFYPGLRSRAVSSIPPVFRKYYPEGLEGFPYNPEKAKELLDEAGYVDVDGDGFREDPNGEKFVIRVAAMAGGDIAEPLAQFYLQQWEAVGLKAELTTGRLLDFNAFYDKVQNDDPEIDVFFGAWGVGKILRPSESKGEMAKYNFSRFVSEENNRLISEIESPKTLTDPSYKVEAFKKWQEYFIDQAVEVPLTYRYEIFPVNKRVKNYYVGYDLERKPEFGIHMIELTSEEPVK